MNYEPVVQQTYLSIEEVRHVSRDLSFDIGYSIDIIYGYSSVFP